MRATEQDPEDGNYPPLRAPLARSGHKRPQHERQAEDGDEEGLEDPDAVPVRHARGDAGVSVFLVRVNVLEGTYNGMRALPAQPSDATQPIDPDWISTGKTSTMTMIRMGQNGERKKPRIEKATAERIRLGMTQMITSSAMEMSVLRVSVIRLGATKVGDADGGLRPPTRR